MNIHIEVNTKEEKEMLDYMWTQIDTEEQFHEWFACLDDKQQNMAISLKEMLLLSLTDIEVNADESMLESSEILGKYGKRRSGA